jgi:hypothetical protein
MQDVLDPLFQHRFYAIRKALREKGWSGEVLNKDLYSKNGTSTNFQFDYAGPGKNIVAMNVCGIQDNLDCAPEQFAERIDFLARAREEFEIVSNYRDGLGYGNDIEDPDEINNISKAWCLSMGMPWTVTASPRLRVSMSQSYVCRQNTKVSAD